VASIRDRHIREVTNDLALAVANVSNKALRNHFFGELITLTEGMSLENILDGYRERNCQDGRRLTSLRIKLMNG
jgi:hypothetical protein